MLAGQPAPVYLARFAHRNDSAVPLLSAPLWDAAEVAPVDRFHDRSTEHHPRTTFRLLHDEAGLFGRFDVQDRYVLARRTVPQSMVCQDSCVEFFFRPTAASGYFNFEFNAIGTTLTFYITEPGAPSDSPNIQMTPDDLALIQVRSSLSGTIDPEIPARLNWQLGFSIGWKLIGRYVNDFASPPRGSMANFYKCADHSSHPHWASWADIGERLAFHQPDRFGSLVFQNKWMSGGP